MLEITLASRSEQGQRSDNEDALAGGCNGSAWYAVLADGAGGHRGGARAAQRAIASMEAALQAASSDEFAPEALTRAVLSAHDELRYAQQQAQGTDRMYTTVVALWLDTARSRALWTHVGDSRLYRVRRGAIDRVTVDDSIVQRMFDGGLLTIEQARNHPLKNQLIAALGIDEELQPHTLSEPVELQDGDAFLLCSDGWWNPLADADIPGTMADAVSPREWLDAMQVRIQSRACAEQDNFSAIAVWIGDARVHGR